MASYPMTESQLQALCFQSHWNKYPEERGLLYMNYNNPKNALHGAHLRALGMIKGVADMTYLSKSGAVFLEFKTEVGKQSPAQVEWQAKVMTAGYAYWIIRNETDFWNAIKGYYIPCNNTKKEL